MAEARGSSFYKVYCDESCHLQNDRVPVMVLGVLWCSADQSRAIAERVREIKQKHSMNRHFEAKWSKVSPAGLHLYMDLVDYFFDNDDLHFRVLVAHKNGLRHEDFNQTHDDWYYKMYREGNWVEIVERAYPIFQADFVKSRSEIAGWEVHIKVAPLREHKERSFWHLVSQGSKDDQFRHPDLQRCARIAWVRSVIDHACEDGMKRWEQTRGGDETVAISIPDFSYIVFLSKRFPAHASAYLLLETAYYIESEKRRGKYRREYEAYRETKLQKKPTPL